MLARYINQKGYLSDGLSFDHTYIVLGLDFDLNGGPKALLIGKGLLEPQLVDISYIQIFEKSIPHDWEYIPVSKTYYRIRDRFITDEFLQECSFDNLTLRVKLNQYLSTKTEGKSDDLVPNVTLRYDFSPTTNPSSTEISENFTSEKLSKHIRIDVYSFHIFSGETVESFAADNKILNLYILDDNGDCFCLFHAPGMDNSTVLDVIHDGVTVKLYHKNGFTTHLRTYDLSFVRQTSGKLECSSQVESSVVSKESSFTDQEIALLSWYLSNLENVAQKTSNQYYKTLMISVKKLKDGLQTDEDVERVLRSLSAKAVDSYAGNFQVNRDELTKDSYAVLTKLDCIKVAIENKLSQQV